jgi:asparagine synthase (glutamine-hydrolysing)
MPGIAGIIGHIDESESNYLIKEMTCCMKHDEFYGMDILKDEKIGLIAGWTYYKDISDNLIPVWNENKDIYIILVGQIFPTSYDLDWLKRRGHNILNKGYYYLTHLYEEIGDNVFERINGQFAGILADRRKNICYIFNDRFGFGRIYYREIDNKIFFSTETKSLLKIFPETREIDPLALSDIFTCGCTLKNRCLFKNISILPPASFIKFENGIKTKKSIYLSQTAIKQAEYIDKEYYFQKIKETFKNILPRYLDTERPIGISITGGKDTRIILSYADLSKSNFRCYTFSSSYRETRDEKIGKYIAKIYGLSFLPIKVGDEFFKLFPRLAEKTIYVTDGLMDVSGAVGLYTNKMARAISPIRLTGNYGQEIFEGYTAFKPSMIGEKFVNFEFKDLLRSSYNTYWEEKKDCDKFSFIILKQLPWHHYNRYKLESSQVVVYSPFIDNDIVDVVFRAPYEIRQNPNNIRSRLYHEGNSILADIPTDLGYKYDDASLLRRLNTLFYNFTFKAEYAYDHGMPNWLAIIDFIFKPIHLEKIFLGRHKFHHFRVWYRDIFSDYIKEILLDKKTLNRPFINKNAVKRIVLRHTKGIANHTFEIHQLLTMELIYRQLIEAF